MCREAITLVQDHHAGNRVEVERLQDGFDGGDLLIDVGCRRIDHMQEYVGIPQFVQRGAKGEAAQGFQY